MSDQLKNVKDVSEIKDVSTLENIENVKGYETFVSDGKYGLTWQADGADIYYQGSTEKQLPVAVKLTYKLDGKEAGELAIDAAYAGELGVPVLFCAGDDACVAEARALFPGLAAVVTKEALSWTSALSRHPQAVCDDIYRTVRAAVPGAGTLVPYCMPGPLSVEIRYKRMEDAARAALTDRNGHPFAQPDPFTRSGVVDGVSALF